MLNKKPLVLVDLDDNLFQTPRKMSEKAINLASITTEGKPSGYMTEVQKDFVDWLLKSADVIPVTARSTQSFSRVLIPFNGFAICSHGGAILTKNKKIDKQWNLKVTKVLAPYQKRLAELSKKIMDIGSALGYSLRSWVIQEEGNNVYVITKHNNQGDECLLEIVKEANLHGLTEEFIIHVNGNNLAFLPKELNKKNAVKEIISRDFELHGERPILGFGDSLSDLGFMNECDFWGTPNNSQITRQIMDNINET